MKHVKCYQAGYPRPQMVRRDYQLLDGEWSFGFGEEADEKRALAGDLPRKILVPFSYETQKSGIGDPSHHEVVWYARKIAKKAGRRTILNFEGADYRTDVFINGAFVGTHTGAYSRFSFDVTDYLNGKENVLAVRCTDPDHPAQVRGKQRWKRESFGCWYVQTTGIYKSVWLEYVADTYLTSLKITPDISDYSVRFEVSVNRPADDVKVVFDVSFRGEAVQSAMVSARDLTNSVSVGLTSEKLTYQAELWSVANPALYDVEIRVYRGTELTDEVGSYFGLRDYRAQDGKILLNEVPFYSRLLLDQGYWAESGLTPPDEDALVKDIALCKEMGFNGVRKHQKVEDERFFYYADVMGFLVWCELPSNHWYSDDALCAITEEWLRIVRQNYNHPSLVTWVAFNESWGVRNIARNKSQSSLASALYYLTKSVDPMRPVISNDGWQHAESDILTLHHYEQNGARLYKVYDSAEKLACGSADNSQPLPYADGYAYRGQPIIISEFGGTSYTRDASRGWGYGNGVSGDEEFLERFGALIGAIGKMNVSGYCYTQITDVEQEVNGLLYTDRTPKVPLAEIAKRNV